MKALATLVTTAAVVAITACGPSGASDARFPPRPAGCDVKIFHVTPDVPTENIGPVHVRCEDTVSEADCLRSLADIACGMGADVVWGIGDEATKKDGRSAWFGRAAHSKGPTPAPASSAR